MLGIRLGAASVTALMNGERNVMAGILDNQLKFTPFDSVVKQHQVNEELYELLKTLNT
jgi:6-phosphofructokinase 1